MADIIHGGCFANLVVWWCRGLRLLRLVTPFLGSNGVRPDFSAEQPKS